MQKRENPFGIIPWNLDFLSHLESYVQSFDYQSSDENTVNQTKTPESKKSSRKKTVESKQYSLLEPINTISGKTSAKANEEVFFDKQNIVLIFPNARPKRYMENRYKNMAKKNKKAHILPMMLTASEVFNLCLNHWERGQKPCQELQSLDRIALLHEAVLEISKNLPASSVLRRLTELKDENNEKDMLDFGQSQDIQKKHLLKSLSLAKFYPWANSLDTLFEECFNQLQEVKAIHNTEEEVPPLASALLSALSSIAKIYLDYIKQNTYQELTTKIKHHSQSEEVLGEELFDEELLTDEGEYRLTTPGFTRLKTALFVLAYQAYQKGTLEQDLENENQLLKHIAELLPQNSHDQSEFFMEFMPELFRGKTLVFAGFVRLSAVEDTLFRYFWNEGAKIVWHSDPRLANYILPKVNEKKDNNIYHYACLDHALWLKKWQASGELLFEESTHESNINFFSAYDSHSQLRAVQKDLQNYLQSFQVSKPEKRKNNAQSVEGLSADQTFTDMTSGLADDSVAVILPRSDALMPLLHELPDKNINISMGYPVKRTLFAQYLQIILNLQLNKEEKSKSSSHYHWSDILEILRHPYTRMLLPVNENTYAFSHKENTDSTQNNGAEKVKDEETFNKVEEQRAEWRSLLYYMEKHLRKGDLAYIYLPDFLDDVLGDIDNHNFQDEILSFCRDYFNCVSTTWENSICFGHIGKNLQTVVDFLLTHGSTLWQNFPLDAEALVRALENMIPSLKKNLLSHAPLPPKILFPIINQLVNEERIPFEADPLEGLQILGMLESRLLRFENVFIFDMNEEYMPGPIQQDPLMPDSLRNILGLPDTHMRDILTAHTFYRLLAGAKNVWLYWQEGVYGSEIQGKDIRSRYVEECIWKKEQEQKRLLQNNPEVIRQLPISIEVQGKVKKKHIPVTVSAKQKLKELLQKPLSSTALDTYIQCPAKFYYKYLAKLKDIEDVNEGDNERELGNWIHEFLKKFYEERLGQEIKHTEETKAQFLEALESALEENEIHQFVSAQSYILFKEAAVYHFTRYYDAMPEEFEVVALEDTFTALLPEELYTKHGKEHQIKLEGTFDRLDKRCSNEEELYLILDYKTGKKQNLSSKIWNDIEFWETLKSYNQDENSTGQDKLKDDIMDTIAQKFSSIQLPLYLYIYKLIHTDIKVNAGWIFLKEKYPEVLLMNFDKKSEDSNELWETLEEIHTEYMPNLMQFCVNHLLDATHFNARQNKSCAFCPHALYC